MEVREPDPLGREPQQIVERGARGPQPVALPRPAEPGEQAAGIEDVADRAPRPFGLDQTGDEHVVEPSVRRRVDVDQMHALGRRPPRERPALDPPPHNRRQPGGVDAAARVAQRPVRRLERREALPDERPSFAAAAGRPAGRGFGRVALQKRPQRRELGRQRPRRAKRAQLAGQREHAIQGGGRGTADPCRGAPLFGATRERVHPRGEAHLRQGTIERPDRGGGRRRSVRAEPEVRRPQQLDRRPVPEPARRERDHQVDGRRVRLDRERQRVAGPHRKPRLAEHRGRQVQIRQGTLHHHGGGRRRAPAGQHGTAHLARNPAQFLFAVPPSETGRPRRRIGHYDGGRRAGAGVGARFGETGQQVLEPLPVPAVEHRVGRDHGDPRQPRQTRQQVEVRRVQACRVRGLVRHRHDHLGHRPRRPRGEQPLPQPVLVDEVERVEPAVVGAERGHQEAGLRQQTPGAAVEAGARLEFLDQEPLEGVDRAPVAPELVVERQQRRYDAGAQPERRRATGGQRVAGRGADDHLALRRGQQRRARPAPPAQPFVPLAARDQRRPPGVDAGRGERAPQLVRRGSGGGQHRHRRRGRRGAAGERLRDRPLKRAERRRAQQAGLARRDQGALPGTAGRARGSRRPPAAGLRDVPNPDCRNAVEDLCSACGFAAEAA